MSERIYIFCARDKSNMPSTDSQKPDNGLCESRRVTSELAYIPHGGEVICRGCGHITAATFGLVGHGYLDANNVMQPHTLYARTRR